MRLKFLYAPLNLKQTSRLNHYYCFIYHRGPVWVYVLERRRAVEVWNTLMGDRDPTVACTTTPTSLRALYGLSRAQNALMGSPDTHTAEIQIASLFASSPLYPMHDLPTDLSSSSQFLSTSSAAMSSSQRTPGRYSTPSVTSTTSPGHATRLNSTGKPVTRFRARPLPATTIVPSIAPRTTKAAALRAGTLDPATLDAAAKGPKVAPTREQQVLAFMDVPGHKRSSTIPVASTAAPAIAPRMTKAAALRLGIEPPPRRVRHSMGGAGAGAEGVFEGVPGHKRRESIAVLSTRPPAVGPRLNRSAALRAEKDKAPPTSFQCTSHFPLSHWAICFVIIDWLTDWLHISSQDTRSARALPGRLHFWLAPALVAVRARARNGAHPICAYPRLRPDRSPAAAAPAQQPGRTHYRAEAEQERAAARGKDGGDECKCGFEEACTEGARGLSMYIMSLIAHGRGYEANTKTYISRRWPHMHLCDLS